MGCDQRPIGRLFCRQPTFQERRACSSLRPVQCCSLGTHRGSDLYQLPRFPSGHYASRPVTIAIAALGYFLFELLYTATDIPYNCMAGLATHADDERRSINVHRNIGSCVGTAIGAVACFPLLNLFGALGDNGSLDPTNGSRGFFLTACVMAAVCIGGCLVHYFTTKERVVPENKEEEHVGMPRRDNIRSNSLQNIASPGVKFFDSW